jgi:hypothetical protein
MELAGIGILTLLDFQARITRHAILLNDSCLRRLENVYLENAYLKGFFCLGS